jgi:mannosyltransferase OCH1-like enzyme
MPQEYREYRESWRRHHPGWEMRLWTDENLPADFVRKEAYERLRKPAERSDIIRLEVLLRFGGVYVDTDVECLRSIEPLLEGTELLMAYNKPGKLTSAVIGARPGHPLIERAVGELRPVTEYGIDKWGTGPYFFNKLIEDYPEITIFPPEYFNPTTPEERERAYAVNYHALSWKDPEDFRAAFVKAERKLADAQRRIEELERWRRRRRQLVSLLATPLRWTRERSVRH